VCIVFHCEDAGISGVSNWKQSICVTCRCRDEVGVCGQKKGGGQKLASRAKVWSALSTPTPDFEYSPMCFSKKVVFPWRLIISIHSNGLPIL